MTDRALVVWWDQAVVGLLTQDRSGDLSFGYDPAWVSGNKRPLSRSLPLRDQPFNRAACRPFFGGLLPEADQRQGAAAALGVSVANEACKRGHDRRGYQRYMERMVTFREDRVRYTAA